MSVIVDEHPASITDKAFEPYNIKSCCSKCDEAIIHTSYHSRSFEEEGCAVLLCEFQGQDEHIVRTCSKCGFEFFQEPLSLKKAVEGRYGQIVLPEEPTEAW